MSRPDRVAKLQLRKVQRETVVKAYLKGLLQGDKAEALAAITKRVFECSYKTHNASIALNLLIRKLFHNVEDVSSVNVPKFWDQTFVRQLLLGTDSAKKPHQEITDLYTEYPSLKPTSDRSIDDMNIYTFAAIKLGTNIKNHMILNLEPFVKKFVHKIHSKEDGREIQRRLFGWKNEEMSLTPQAEETLKVIRKIIEVDVVGKAFLKSTNSPNVILKLFIHFNRVLETLESKLFNILPICKIKRHFVTIDTLGMKGILKEMKVLKKDNDNKTEVIDRDLWYSFLDVDKLKTKAKTFTGTIDTDGIAVNVHFTCPKRFSDSQEVDLNGKRVIGVDPGRTNIFYMAEEIEKDEFKTYRLTRKQYYVESGIISAKKNTEYWNLQIKEELEKTSLVSPKSVSLENFHMYLQTMLSVKEKLWKEYLHIKWSDQRLKLYGGKKKVFSKFLNQLGDNVVLAYGAAKFVPGGKGEVSIPVSRAYKECSSRFEIIPVDEFRTTKLYHKDFSVLNKVATYKEGKITDVRGLSWYSTNDDKPSKFVNRDLNAAINILRCVTLPQRPIALSRIKKLEKIVQKVGKII
jgi:hypothetical protein